MVETGANESEGVLAAVTELASVTEAHVVAGNFDLIVEVEDRDVPSVIRAAASEIQDFDGVERTKTYISLN